MATMFQLDPSRIDLAEEFRRNLEPLPKPEKKKFWKRLAEARHRARERRRLKRLDKEAQRKRAST